MRSREIFNRITQYTRISLQLILLQCVIMTVASSAFAVEHFIDKTTLIKAVVEDKHQILLITRPSSWGKTFNLMELERFFTPNIRPDCSCNEALQTYKERALYGKAINEHKDILAGYFGKYPTIFLSLKINQANTVEALHKQIADIIKSVYRRYPYLANSLSLNSEQI